MEFWIPHAKIRFSFDEMKGESNVLSFQEVLLDNLMSTINTTLKDSLLSNSRASDTIMTSETSDSMRSSTISSSSTSAGEKPGSDGFEAAENDFMYETSCSLETKNYEMGKNVERHDVPTTVQELSNVTSNVDSGVSRTSKNCSTSKDLIDFQWSVPFNVVTSLPPLPRSHSASKFDQRRDSGSSSRTLVKSSDDCQAKTLRKSELEEVTLMAPVEVKIKTRGNTNFHRSEENSTEKMREETEKITEAVHKAEPAIIVNGDEIDNDKG